MVGGIIIVLLPAMWIVDGALNHRSTARLGVPGPRVNLPKRERYSGGSAESLSASPGIVVHNFVWRLATFCGGSKCYSMLPGPCMARGAVTVGGSSAVSICLNFCEWLVTFLELRQILALGLSLVTFSRSAWHLISYVHILNFLHPPLDAAQDGVLLHGTSVLPEAKRALSVLEGDNPLHR